MKNLSRIGVVTLALTAQALLGSAKAVDVPAECQLDEQQISELKTTAEAQQALIDQIKGEADLDKRYALLQQHLGAMMETAADMGTEYRSLIDLCGHMSSPREDAIIRLLEQRLAVLEILMNQLIMHRVEYQSPYKTRGRPW